MQLSKGFILKNRYVIQECIGQGGFGKVYLAGDSQFSNISVAVKQRIPVDPNDPREEELFTKEAKSLAQLKRPGIPEVYDFFCESCCHFIVMEFIRGKSLESLLKERGGILAVEDVVPLMKQLASILQYVHSLNPPVIHRDIKPENLILTQDGKLYLVDFGISRRHDSSKKRDTMRIGTIGYMAPEQFAGASTPASDIFSYGATFHHLLSGLDPKEKEESRIYHFEPVENLNRNVSSLISSTISQCVKEDPAERLKSAGEILELLGRAQVPAQTEVTPLNADPSFWLQRGNYFFEEKNYKEALKCFVNARKAGLVDENLILRIAQCHRKSGNWDRAANMLEDYERRHSAGEDLIIELSHSIRDESRTLALLDRYGRIHPEWKALRIHRINHLLRGGSLEEAKREVDCMLVAEPGNIALIRQKAMLFEAENNMSGLEGFLNAVPSGVSDDPEVLYLKAIMKEKAGNMGEAFALLKKASEKSDKGEILHQMARLLWKKESFLEARELYARLIQQGYRSVAIKKELGINMSKEGFHEEAVIQLENAGADAPDDCEILEKLGVSLCECGRYSDSLQALLRCASLSPGNHSIYKLIGKCQALLGRLDDAAKSLELYLLKSPGDAAAMQMLDAVRRRMGGNL